VRPGAQLTTDPQFTGFQCKPRRLAAITPVSKQLLAQSPSLDEVLLSDLGRQLGSLIDQICLLGAGPTANQPVGIATAPGVNQIAGTAYTDFVHARRLVGDQRIALDSYAEITSPSGREYVAVRLPAAFSVLGPLP